METEILDGFGTENKVNLYFTYWEGASHRDLVGGDEQWR